VKLKALVLLALFASITSAMATSASVDASEPYLFDLLSKPSYQKSWNELFKGEKNVDGWLAKYAKTKDGPATPRRFVQSDGITYEVSTVCKTHDCGNNIFFVLFAPNGSKAWGLLLKNRTDERFFGNPDENNKQLLRAAAEE
jgi:hypothetical protein